MFKCEALGSYLRGRSETRVPMSFRDIEQVTGVRLPPSAGKYFAWWSNNPSNNVMTKFWIEAGYRAENVDVGGGKLVFRRMPNAPGAAVSYPAWPDKGAAASAWASGTERLSCLYGALRGSATPAPGVDLAEPTGAAWEAERKA